jgi:hypothetical protein
VDKQWIENKVIAECRKLLTDKSIEKIAQSVAAACEADYDSSAVKRLKAALTEADNAIENLWNTLEKGQSVEMIIERIEKRKREKEELQEQIAIEMNRQIVFAAPQIRAFLYSLKKGNVNDENNRKGIINIFLRAVYLWDDRFTLILNGGDKPIILEDIPLEEIEAGNAEFECSSLVAPSPPNAHDPHRKPMIKAVGEGFGFVLYSGRRQNCGLAFQKGKAVKWNYSIKRESYILHTNEKRLA